MWVVSNLVMSICGFNFEWLVVVRFGLKMLCWYVVVFVNYWGFVGNFFILGCIFSLVDKFIMVLKILWNFSLLYSVL